MALDVSELLLDDTDDVPNGTISGEPSPIKRGRGRPRGSTTRRAGGSASRPSVRPSVAGTRELAQLLAKVIGGASILIALVLQADEAAMTPGEANDIAKPAARLLGKSGWAARMTQLAGKGGDWVDLTLALATYGLRLYPLIVLRSQQLELQRQQLQARQRGVPGGPSSEDARVWQGQRQGQRQGQQSQPAQPSGQPDAARDAAIAAQFGGAGFADPDALAAGAYGDIAATVRAHPSY